MNRTQLTPPIGGALMFAALVAGGAARGSVEAQGQTAPKKRAVELVLPLEKVEPANVEAVKKSLESLTRSAYSCSQCLYTQLVEGSCPDCEEDLERSEKAIHPVRRVDVEPAERTVRVTLASGQTLRLSEAERALKKSGAHLRRDALPVLPWSRLILEVADDEQTTEELRDALTTLPLEIVAFHVDEEVGDGATRAIVLLGRNENDGRTTTLGDLAKALRATPFTFADLVWSGPCKVCSESGAAVATCRKCCGTGTDSI